MIAATSAVAYAVTTPVSASAAGTPSSVTVVAPMPVEAERMQQTVSIRGNDRIPVSALHDDAAGRAAALARYRLERAHWEPDGDRDARITLVYKVGRKRVHSALIQQPPAKSPVTKSGFKYGLLFGRSSTTEDVYRNSLLDRMCIPVRYHESLMKYQKWVAGVLQSGTATGAEVVTGMKHPVMSDGTEARENSACQCLQFMWDLHEPTDVTELLRPSSERAGGYMAPLPPYTLDEYMTSDMFVSRVSFPGCPEHHKCIPAFK
jgi:hypothetical protein